MSAGRDRGRERLVRIAAAEDPATAEIWRAALHEAGIEALLKNADALTAFSGGGVLSLDVWVLEGDADAALALIAAEPRRPLRRHAPRVHHRRHTQDHGDSPPPSQPDAG